MPLFTANDTLTGITPTERAAMPVILDQPLTFEAEAPVGGATEAKQDAQIVQETATAAALGATNGVAVVTDANGTLQQYLRGLVKLLITSGTIVLGAGTAAIGKLAANSGVDIGDVDVTSISAGDNNIGNVDVVTLPALVAGTANIGDVDVLTIAAGSNTIGATRDAGPSWTSVHGVASVPFTSADAQTAAAVTDAPTGGQKLVITDLFVSNNSAVAIQFTFVEETSATVITGPFSLAAGTSAQYTTRSKAWKLPVADKKLMVDASAAGNIMVDAHYYSE